MFAAVGLFVLLLIAILVIAFFRFRNPPPSPAPGRTPPAAALMPPGFFASQRFTGHPQPRFGAATLPARLDA